MSVISEDLSKKSSLAPNIRSASESRRAQTTATKTQSPSKENFSFDSTGEIPEDIPSEQQHSPELSAESSFPSYSARSLQGARKTVSQGPPATQSQGTSRSLSSKGLKSPGVDTRQSEEDVTISERTETSMMVDLHRLKKKASEKYVSFGELAITSN